MQSSYRTYRRIIMYRNMTYLVGFVFLVSSIGCKIVSFTQTKQPSQIYSQTIPFTTITHDLKTTSKIKVLVYSCYNKGFNYYDMLHQAVINQLSKINQWDIYPQSIPINLNHITYIMNCDYYYINTNESQTIKNNLLILVTIYKREGLVPLHQFKYLCSVPQNDQNIPLPDFIQQTSETISQSFHTFIKGVPINQSIRIVDIGDQEIMRLFQSGKIQDAKLKIISQLPLLNIMMLSPNEIKKQYAEKLTKRHLEKDLYKFYFHLITMESECIDLETFQKIHIGYLNILYLTQDPELSHSCIESLKRIDQKITPVVLTPQSGQNNILRLAFIGCDSIPLDKISGRLPVDPEIIHVAQNSIGQALNETGLFQVSDLTIKNIPVHGSTEAYHGFIYGQLWWQQMNNNTFQLNLALNMDIVDSDYKQKKYTEILPLFKINGTCLNQRDISISEPVNQMLFNMLELTSQKVKDLFATKSKTLPNQDTADPDEKLKALIQANAYHSAMNYIIAMKLAQGSNAIIQLFKNADFSNGIDLAIKQMAELPEYQRYAYEDINYLYHEIHELDLYYLAFCAETIGAYNYASKVYLYLSRMYESTDNKYLKAIKRCSEYSKASLYSYVSTTHSISDVPMFNLSFTGHYPPVLSAIESKKVLQEKPAIQKESIPDSSQAFDPCSWVNDDIKKQEEANRIIQTLQNWMSAWSEKDVPLYLSYYDQSFKPKNGMNRKKWIKDRYRKLNKKFISVSWTEVPTVTILSCNEARVIFEQKYQSNNYKDKSKKQIVLKRNQDIWLIIEEDSL